MSETQYIEGKNEQGIWVNNERSQDLGNEENGPFDYQTNKELVKPALLDLLSVPKQEYLCESDARNQKISTQDEVDDKNENDFNENEREESKSIQMLDMEEKIPDQNENSLASYENGEIYNPKFGQEPSQLEDQTQKAPNDQFILELFPEDAKSDCYHEDHDELEFSIPNIDMYLDRVDHLDKERYPHENNQIADNTVEESPIKKIVAGEAETEKKEEDFVLDTKFDLESSSPMKRTESCYSQPGDTMKNDSQVIQISDLDKIMDEAASPGLRPARKSRFHPGSNEKEAIQEDVKQEQIVIDKIDEQAEEEEITTLRPKEKSLQRPNLSPLNLKRIPSSPTKEQYNVLLVRCN